MNLEKVDPKRTDKIEELVRKSKEAFDTDVSVGAQEPDGPPDYDFLISIIAGNMNRRYHHEMLHAGLRKKQP